MKTFNLSRSNFVVSSRRLDSAQTGIGRVGVRNLIVPLYIRRLLFAKYRDAFRLVTGHSSAKPQYGGVPSPFFASEPARGICRQIGCAPPCKAESSRKGHGIGRPSRCEQ
eukprot:3411533-Pyramimonas_sp.AAC.1